VAILAAVDDLLFRSKIRAVAKHVNAEVAFAQSGDEILAQAATTRPALVIVDLNSQKSDPVATIAALKERSPATRVIAFASHVHVDLIDAARRAGADQVLARSQFAGSLADILASGA
jgi:DNA-binding NarL/FixJ family response regulator